VKLTVFITSGLINEKSQSNLGRDHVAETLYRNTYGEKYKTVMQ